MAIDSTYKSIKASQFIQDKLSEGSSISAVDLISQFETLVSGLDLTTPQFVADEHHVTRRTSSSASAFNSTFGTIREDLYALYQELIGLSDNAIGDYERYDVETRAIEKKLVDLEDRIENLLLLTQDTEGYHSIVVENFTDKSQTDLTNTTADIDLKSSLLVLRPSNTEATRVFLNDIKEKDISFSVRTTKNYEGRTDSQKSSLVDPFKQVSDTWWTNISMSRAKPVTTELIVKLGETATDISKIFIDLHDSSQSSPLSITPLYSLDNVSYFQLPSNTFTQEVRTDATFNFTSVQAKYVKFIFIKRGPDTAINSAFFNYQIGFKEISFYDEGFTTDTVQTYVSRPLYVTDNDGSAQTFEKLTIDTCERVEENTEANIYIMTSNSSSAPIDSNTVWVPVSPISRSNPKYNLVLDIGDTVDVVIGDNETLDISYDGTADPTGVFVNPAKTFTLVSGVVTSGVDYYTVSGQSSRFSFVNQEDRILSYQLDDSVEFSNNTLELFRNVGEQGLNPNSSTSLVRGTQRGWSFQDPWYSCVVEVLNPEGQTFNFGPKSIILDGIFATGEELKIPSGIHRVRVHKDNWFAVPSGYTSLSELKAADPLYPYNHKALIEGYPYGSSWTEEKIYTGVDLFAEEKMTKISPFDLYYNIKPTDYKFFAIDLDAPDTHVGGNSPTRAFVLKVDSEMPDFQNERFVIRFSLINQLRSYFRVKIDLSTENASVTPAIDSYKVKLG